MSESTNETIPGAPPTDAMQRLFTDLLQQAQGDGDIEGAAS